VRLTLSLLVLLCACATPSTTRVASASAAPVPSAAQASPKPACDVGDADAALGSLLARPSADIIARLGSAIESYRLQDGVWLEGAPVIVNEPFDFGTAMGLGTVGAGLAAATRQKNNALRAEKLKTGTLPPEAASYLDELRACGLHRWALLWGGDTPELLIVTEQYDAAGSRVTSVQRALSPDAAFSAGSWVHGPLGEPNAAVPQAEQSTREPSEQP
jgi:hypothetical protein